MFHWNLLDILCIQFLCTWNWTQHINHRIASEMTLVFWAAEYHFSWPHEGWPGALMARCEKRWLILLESWTTKVTGPQVFITLSLNCTMAFLLSLQMEAGQMGDIVQWAKLCKEGLKSRSLFSVDEWLLVITWSHSCYEQQTGHIVYTIAEQ